MTTANPVTLQQLGSPHGSQAINSRGYSQENIHRNNKLPSKSISQLDRARRAKQDQIDVYNNSIAAGNNLNVSSGAAIMN